MGCVSDELVWMAKAAPCPNLVDNLLRANESEKGVGEMRMGL